MKKIFSFFVMLAVATAGFAASRTLKVNAFSEISAAQSLHVKYVNAPASEAKVDITGPDGIIDEVSVTLKGKRLEIGSKLNNINGKRYKDVVVTVKAPLVTSYKVSSSAEIEIMGPMNLRGKTVTFTASSSGDIKCNSPLEASTIKIKCNSSADVDLSHVTVSDLNIEASSSGDVELDAVNAQVVNVAASSSSDVEMGPVNAMTVNVSVSSSADMEIKNLRAETLNVAASSSSEFKTFGNAVTVNLTASSSAVIKASGLVSTNRNAKVSSGGKIR